MSNDLHAEFLDAPVASRIAQLTARVAELSQLNQNQYSIIQGHKKRYADLEAANAVLRTALEEFADEGNWLLPGDGFGVKAPHWISGTDENPVALAASALSTEAVAVEVKHRVGVNPLQKLYDDPKRKYASELDAAREASKAGKP